MPNNTEQGRPTEKRAGAAPTINRVTLLGNLGRDPEVRTTKEGRKIANLSLATSERWTDAQGERQERTDWHRVVIFTEALANLADQALKKGSRVYVEGQLQTRKWTDKTGEERVGFLSPWVLKAFQWRVKVTPYGRSRSPLWPWRFRARFCTDLRLRGQVR
jgi:primosomal replication protein N